MGRSPSGSHSGSENSRSRKGKRKDRSRSSGKDSGSGSGSRSGSRKRDRSRGRRRSRDKGKKKKSRSRSQSEEREKSPKYAPEDNWRRLENLRSWRGLGKKEKTRPTLTGCEKDDQRDLEAKIKKRLKSGYRSSCIRACMVILEAGFEVPKELLEEMLVMSVQRPGIIQIAQSLQLMAINPNARIGVTPFLRGLGVLIQRNAPVQLVRMWLNLGMPRESRALQYLPYDYDDEEKELAAQDLEDAFGVITDDEEDEKGASRRVMYVTSCKARPEVNGRYERSEDIQAFGRPVYEKITQRKIVRDTSKGKGKANVMSELKKLMLPSGMAAGQEDAEELEEVIVCHYKKDFHRGHGWYFSRDNCSGFVLASSARSTKGPPTGGWFVNRERTKLPDPLRIVDPSKANEDFRNKNKEEARKAIAAVSPDKLKARLQTEDKSVPAAEYFGHFCMLMHLEHLEELRQIKRRNQRLPEMELVRLGWTLDGLPATSIFGRREPKKVTLLGWEDPGSEMGALMLPPGTDLGRLKFKRGDSVTVIESKQQLRKGKDTEEKLGDGFVADMRMGKGAGHDSQIIIRLRGCWPDDAMSRRWRIDKGANSTLYERQLQAMLNLVTKKRPRVSELLITAKVGLADSWSKQWRKGGALSEEDKKKAMLAEEKAQQQALLEGKQVNPCAKIAKLNPGGADSDKLDRALHEVKQLTHLNQSQRDAVRSALKSTCTVIQGPPGTGKTHVSVQILKMWSKTLDLSPLLATSDSNPAVDNIAMGLIKEGVKAVRVGRPDKINRVLEAITLECLLEKEKEEQGALQFAARFKSRSRSRSGSPDPLGLKSKKEDEERKRKEEEEKEERKSRSRSVEVGKRQFKGRGKGKGKKSGGKADFDLQMRILQDADVLCTTTISSGGDFFSKFAFAGILVDEAAQATELAAVVPLILRGTQRLVLVGDQCQLPPTVQSTEAEERGLSLSLYSRMIDGGGVTPFLLDTQFRSHPQIAEFSSRVFYQGRIKNGVEAKDRKPPRGMPWPRGGVPIAFVDVHGDEASEGDSKYNPAEADVVLKLVQDCFFQRELEITDIGVVTPYVAQVKLLKRVIKNIIPEDCDPELMEIASVDQYQGREKELIIFSAVRSNRLGTVGFLADWRRLNVMLTRARRGIVIVGNSRTLKVDEHWEKWLGFYARVSSGRAATPERGASKVEEIERNETPEEKEIRLKKERTEAARKLSMAIRFPGLAMATAEKKDRSRSRSESPVMQGEADKLTVVKGSRTKPRQRTPSPMRAAKVVKEVGVGRKNKASEFDNRPNLPAGTEGGAAAAAPKAKPKAKAKLAIEEDGSGDDGDDFDF